jgi:hypothetical protein
MKLHWIAPIALLLPLALPAQTNYFEPTAEGLAKARLFAASHARGKFTTAQCLADLASWDANDDANSKAKDKMENWWYQKLSTEELARLDREAGYCVGVLRVTHRREDALQMTLFDSSFLLELGGRAEAILADHHLMQEYLLRPNSLAD